MPTDYQQYLNSESKSRKPSPIRELIPLAAKEGMLSLGAGNPNPETFPYAGMTLTLKTGETLAVDPLRFHRCLNYDLTSGLKELNAWLRELQVDEHKLGDRSFRLSIGCGSQDLLTKAFDMVIQRGRPLLVEDPTYTGALNFLYPQQCELVGIPVDKCGISATHLKQTLETWPDINTRPKVLYTIPVGGNPTGISATLERKKEIYKICQDYDILVFEDDPYYYLQFEARVPSYLSMDVDGRVLRFDSLSKILSSGLRLGWVTGPEELVERIDLHSMSSNLQPSGISQLVAYQLLEKWDLAGFYEHVKTVASFYKGKCQDFNECLLKHMEGLAEWTMPNAGMFIWLKLLGGVTDSSDLIKNRAAANNVLAIPGTVFIPSQQKTPYIRLSYSNVSKDDMDEALRRLAETVREVADTASLQ